MRGSMTAEMSIILPSLFLMERLAEKTSLIKG